MSVNYEIREYLSLLPGTEPSVPYLMARRLAFLGADMLMDGRSYVDTLRVKKGDREAVFSGTGAGPALKEAIGLLLEAEEEDNKDAVEVDLAYGFCWSAGDEELSSLLSPFGFCALLDSLEEEALEKLSYAMWNNADSEYGMGSVTCYGTDGEGTVRHGEAEFEEVGTLPAEAAWYTEESTYAYADTPFTAELAEACRKLSIAAGNPEPEKSETYTVDGIECHSRPDLIWDGEEEGEYYLGFTSLPTPESAENYVAAVKEVLRLTGEESYEAEFLDLNAKKPRMLRLIVLNDGAVRYEMTKA